jgi:hypothetical protein
MFRIEFENNRHMKEGRDVGEDDIRVWIIAETRAWSSGFSLVVPGANTKTRLKPELHAPVSAVNPVHLRLNSRNSLRS